MQDPSDHLLRTLAAVPVSSEILDLGCGNGRHTEALLRLGFPVHACDPRPEAVEETRAAVQDLIGESSVETVVQVTPLDSVEYPDATFDWVVADRAETYAEDEAELRTLLDEARRVLKPGGWLYLTVPAAPDPDDGRPGQETADRYSTEQLDSCRAEAGLAEASAPSRVEELGEPRIRAIFRAVDAKTPV